MYYRFVESGLESWNFLACWVSFKMACLRLQLRGVQWTLSSVHCPLIKMSVIDSTTLTWWNRQRHRFNALLHCGHKDTRLRRVRPYGRSDPTARRLHNTHPAKLQLDQLHLAFLFWPFGPLALGLLGLLVLFVEAFAEKSSLINWFFWAVLITVVRYQNNNDIIFKPYEFLRTTLTGLVLLPDYC